MRTHGETRHQRIALFVFWIIALSAFPVLADDTVPGGTSAGLQNSQNHSVARTNYLHFGLLNLSDKHAMTETNSLSMTPNNDAGRTQPNITNPPEYHSTTDNQHSAFVYHMADKETLQLHFDRHGANINLHWQFN